MPLNTMELRSIFESDGYVAGTRKFHALLGLTDKNGYRNVNERGEPCVKNALIKPGQISIRALAESIGSIGGRNPTELTDANFRQGLQPLALLEAGSEAAVQPSAFGNINSFGSAFGGLLEVKVLEAYDDPAFIGDTLMPTEQSGQRYEKRPGIANLGDSAEVMAPGAPHPRVQMSERYIETPQTVKRGLAIDVTREAVFFDQTNQVMDRAADVGRVLRREKEKRQLRTILGIDNSYKYGGTSYDTYLASGNWINSFEEELVDWTDFDAALNLFAAMKDQETGEAIDISAPWSLLTMPAKYMTAKNILTNTSVESRTNSQATVGIGGNPISGMVSPPVTSSIAYQLLIDSGVSAAVAAKRWYVGNTQRAFRYIQNFPLRVERVDASDYQMRDSDLVMSVFADEMGVPAVIDPRYVVQGAPTT